MWSELAEDLEKLMKDASGDVDLWEKYGEISAGNDIEQILANLDHFVADGDIRAKDPIYKQMQENEMRKLIKLLKSGGPLSDILKINFLHNSK